MAAECQDVFYGHSRHNRSNFFKLATEFKLAIEDVRPGGAGQRETGAPHVSAQSIACAVVPSGRPEAACHAF